MLGYVKGMVGYVTGHLGNHVSQWAGAPGETSEPVNPGTPGNGQAWGPGHPRKRVSQCTGEPEEDEPVRRKTRGNG